MWQSEQAPSMSRAPPDRWTLTSPRARQPTAWTCGSTREMAASRPSSSSSRSGSAKRHESGRRWDSTESLPDRPLRFCAPSWETRVGRAWQRRGVNLLNMDLVPLRTALETLEKSLSGVSELGDRARLKLEIAAKKLLLSRFEDVLEICAEVRQFDGVVPSAELRAESLVLSAAAAFGKNESAVALQLVEGAERAAEESGKPSVLARVHNYAAEIASLD